MNSPTVESQLQKLNIHLPPAPAGVGAYLGVIHSGNYLITSGQLPWKDGKFLFSGQIGAELTVEQGYVAARQCAINAIAQLNLAIGRSR